MENLDAEDAHRGARVQQDVPRVAAQDLPPPPPRHRHAPSYWDLMRQLKDMGQEPFEGSVDAIVADNWRRQLDRNLDNIRCPEEFRVDLTAQYLRGDALVWWDGVVEQTRGRYELTYGDFTAEFSRKFFPREAMDEKENAFQDLRQGARSVREYELEFCRLRRFAGRHLDETEQIRRFLKGLRLEIRNRCMVRDYSSMVELVEKAAAQERGLAEEQRLAKGTPPKQGKAPEPPKRIGEQTGQQRCYQCKRYHYGPCIR